MINFKKTFHYLKLGHLKESNKFQKIGIYIISLACLVFVFFSWVSYKILNYSYNSEMNLYNDSYLASIYANKIKCDIYVTRLYSLYSVTNNISMITEVNAAKKELISDTNNYKSLHNLTDEEKDIIDQLEATNDSKRWNTLRYLKKSSFAFEAGFFNRSLLWQFSLYSYIVFL